MVHYKRFRFPKLRVSVVHCSPLQVAPDLAHFTASGNLETGTQEITVRHGDTLATVNVESYKVSASESGV